MLIKCIAGRSIHRMKLIDSVKWSGTDCDRREKAEVDSVTVHLPLRTPPSEDAFLVHRW